MQVQLLAGEELPHAAGVARKTKTKISACFMSGWELGMAVSELIDEFRRVWSFIHFDFALNPSSLWVARIRKLLLGSLCFILPPTVTCWTEEKLPLLDI